MVRSDRKFSEPRDGFKETKRDRNERGYDERDTRWQKIKAVCNIPCIDV